MHSCVELTRFYQTFGFEKINPLTFEAEARTLLIKFFFLSPTLNFQISLPENRNEAACSVRRF